MRTDTIMSAKRETTLNLEFEMEPLRGSQLVSDYLKGRGSAPRFYGGAPDDPDAYREKAREVDGRFDDDARRRAIELISAPSEEARRRLERVAEDDGYFVTTGQQPGLFTGPLYSIYKALSAVARARALESVLDRPVAALFWVASEDHDWDEVHHTWIVDVDNDLREIAVSSPAGARDAPLHRIVLEEELERALSCLEEHLPETDFSDRYLEILRNAYAPGSTLPGGFRNFLEELLGPFGLCFVDAHDSGLKEASLPLLIRELDEAADREALLRKEADALEEEGYAVQVPILEGGVNLFLEGPAGRERIYRDSDGFHLRHSELRLGRDEIVARAEEDPRVLSPNVLLRPVAESAVFPTVSYVAGPGETAYFGQLRSFFERHGIRMPVVAPRTSMTIVEGKNRKVLEKFDLEVGDLDRPYHELASDVARDEIPTPVRKALGELRGAVGEKSSQLLDAAREIDPTLKGPVTHARNTAFKELDEVEKKIVQAVKRQDEIALEQLEKAQVHFFPGGKPQERVLNVLYYLVRYGPDFLPAVSERCSVDLGGGGA